MQPLSSSDLVRAWEAGARRHPVDRGVLLLSLLHPDQPLDAVWQWTVGHRNRQLLAFYQQTAGTQMDCMATCRECGQVNEFSVQVHDITFEPPEETVGTWQDGELAIWFRQPNNLDLVSAAMEQDLDKARRLLAQRCITRARHRDRDIDASRLPDPAIVAVGEAIRDQDPQVDLHFDIICAACNSTSSILFDVMAFVWLEINRFAQRTLHEVHLLATAYGWSEADILAMSPPRRQFYLDQLTV